MKLLITIIAVVGAIVAIVISRSFAKKRDKHFLGEQRNGYFLKKTSMSIADAFSGFIVALLVSFFPLLGFVNGAVVYIFFIFFWVAALGLLLYTFALAKWRIAVEDDNLTFYKLFRSPLQVKFDDIYLVKGVTRSRVAVATRAWASRRTFNAYDIYVDNKAIATINEFDLNYNRLIDQFGALGVIE